MIRNPQGRAALRASEMSGAALCTSIIVAAELRYGCARNDSPRLRRAVEAVLGEIAVLPFDVPADAAYGEIRAALEAEGRPIGGNDLLIAAYALAVGGDAGDGECGGVSASASARVENLMRT